MWGEEAGVGCGAKGHLGERCGKHCARLLEAMGSCAFESRCVYVEQGGGCESGRNLSPEVAAEYRQHT